MTVYEFLKRLDPETMINFSTEKYGFFYAGKVKFAKHAFTNETYDENIISSHTDKYGNVSVIIK